MHLTSIMGVTGSISTQNSENPFSGSFSHCQTSITCIIHAKVHSMPFYLSHTWITLLWRRHGKTTAFHIKMPMKRNFLMRFSKISGSKYTISKFKIPSMKIGDFIGIQIWPIFLEKCPRDWAEF